MVFVAVAYPALDSWMTGVRRLGWGVAKHCVTVRVLTWHLEPDNEGFGT